MGGAFDPEFGSSSCLVDTGAGTCLLIDCGCTTYSDLCRTGTVDKVTHVVITHLHDDHCGSLGSLLNHRFHKSHSPVTLLFPVALERPLRTLLELQRTNRPVDEVVHMLMLTGSLSDSSRKVGSSAVEFVDTASLHQLNMPSFSYIILLEDQVLAYSGDLGDADFLFAALQDRGIHRALVCHDTTFNANSRAGHAYYQDLQMHQGEWEIRGYHNRPDQKPSDCTLKLVYEDEKMRPLLY